MAAGAAQGSIFEPDGTILGFEKMDDLSSIKASLSTYQQSETISVLGSKSLKWEWTRGASLELPLIHYQSQKIKISPFAKTQCLVLWIYNDKPSLGQLTFSIGSKNSKELSCSFQLNYKGWRTAHIPLSQMNGEKVPAMGELVSYDRLHIEVSKDHPEPSGIFFIDDVYTTVLDARHPSGDRQAPYVHGVINGATHATQWLGQKSVPTKEQLSFSSDSASPQELKALRDMIKAEVQSSTQAFAQKGLSKKKFQKVMTKFKALKIQEIQDSGLTYLQGPYIALAGQGLPKNLIEEGKEQGHYIAIRSFEGTLFELAKSYITSNDDEQKQKLKHCFLLATRAYLQSGWAAGSNMGALHHLGYNNRKIAPSLLMMKEELREAGLLREVSDSLNWFVVAQVIKEPHHTDPDLDLFNTVLYSHYLATMMHPNDSDGVHHAKLLSRWMGRTFADHSQSGGFKPDGTSWHHWGHYPAYTNGAINNAVMVTNKLSRAGFPLSPKGLAGLQNAVKTIMLYSQGDRYPRSLCGRHPLQGSHRSFIHKPYTQEFVHLAPVDRDLLKLHQYHTKDGQIHGHWTLPYSALNLHRRGETLVSVRGFSQYAWGSEIYNFNRFGRYQSYGTIDIIYKDEKALAYAGYDWNLHPGTTITYLPLHELESPLPIWMVKGSTRFANGVHDAKGHNGAHGFMLNDSMLTNLDPKYEEIFTKEKLTARKSTFFMDDMILCLGSHISGKHPSAPVYTVLTQRHLDTETTGVAINGETQSFPSNHTGKTIQRLHDGHKTGYLITGPNANIIITQKEQVSRGDECTFNEQRRPPRGTKKGKPNLRREPETRGNYLSAVIDHGIKPEDERYGYIIFPAVNGEEFEVKSKAVQHQPELYYSIISQKDTLHAVKNQRSSTETYICYEAQDMIPHEALHAVSEPCLLMINKRDGHYNISAALPDLHLSAFSREHQHKSYASRPHAYELIFEGEWTLSQTSPHVSASYRQGQTIITIIGQDGISRHFSISKP